MSSGAKPSGRSRWRAVLAASVVPGWGQLYLGHRRQAYGLLAVDVLIVATLAGFVAWFQIDVVKFWLDSTSLLVIAAINLVLLAYRGAVAMSTYSVAPVEPASGLGVMGMALAVLLVLAPHMFVGYLTLIQYDLIESVFADTDPVAAVTTTTTSLPSTTTTMTSTSSSAGVSTTTSLPSTTTTTTQPAIWDGLDRLNIVLLGADAGEGRTGLRTDTTIVVSIDPETGETAMFSIPRDLSNAPLPEGMGLWECHCFPDLITHLYDSAVRNPSAYPGPQEPPFNAIKGVLGEIFGIPIHYYALVTLDGFVGVVDALGGVTIDVPETIIDETYPHENGTTEYVEIPAGAQHLDGHLALAYSRIRRHSDDFARMHRQRCVLGAVIDQTTPLDIIANYGALARAIKDNVSTDIPQDRLADFVDLIALVSTDHIATLRITRSVYKTGSAPGRVYYDIGQIREDAQWLMDDPAAAEAGLGLTDLDTTCDRSFD